MHQQITLVGNLGQDPEMRFTPNGHPVTNFTIATSRNWNDNSGQKKTETIWFRVTVWGRMAEVVSQYLKKGRQAMVIGRIKEPEIWTDREGASRCTLEVVADRVLFLGGTQGAGGNNGYNGQQANGNGAAEYPPIMEEDIPF